MTRIKLSQATAVFLAALLIASTSWAEAVLTQVSGEVEIGRGEPIEWTTAHTGQRVQLNERIRTGSDGRVEVKMDAGTLRVHENSMLRLPPATAKADQVELEQGRSLFDVIRRGGRSFEVHTPTVVVSVKGTRFGVDAGVDVGEVTVYRGTVGVREVGAADMMETLVREGFLATGGVGVPVELDVSSASDPWQSWQEFDRAQQDELRRPNRMGEMDRARATLHRSTAAAVIVKAAERRPEIADRLKKMQNQAQGEQQDKGLKGSGKGNPDDMKPMPAAPDFGSGSPDASKKQMLQMHLENDARSMKIEEMSTKVMESKQVVDGERADEKMDIDEMMDMEDMTAAGFDSTSMNLDFAAVYELSPMNLMLVQQSLEDLQIFYQVNGVVPANEADLMIDLENKLITRGMDPASALKTIQVLTGN